MIAEDSKSLLEIILLLSAAVFIVAIFLKLKISPVLGYFVAGAAIGVHGFQVVQSSAAMHIFAEFGIVFLLFLIGLELTLERLASMRRHVFGLGTLQVVITAVVIMLFCRALGMHSSDSLIIGCAFALSSTAIVLQVLQETGIQSNQVGRLSIAVLLMQDFTVVPLLVFVSLLGVNEPQNLLLPISVSLVKAAVVLVIIFVAGRLLLRPFFKLIASTKSSELFAATTLLIVLGAAYITEKLELSMAMGAFVAGLLLAETEYRHEVEQVISPFKSLLLGLFFMNVGMAIDLRVLLDNLALISCISVGLVALKSFTIAVLAKVFGFKTGPAIHAGLLLAQGSEFALILFGLEASKEILSSDVINILISVVTMTMAFTPLLSRVGSSIAQSLKKNPDLVKVKEKIQEDIMDIDNHVIIAGFGRVGRMVAKMLSEEQMNYIAIDVDHLVVDKAQKEGFPIFRGNINKKLTLECIAAERASTVVIAMQNDITVKKTIKILNENFPNVTIVARVPDFSDSSTYKKMGAHKLVPETYETGLQIGAEVLSSVGLGPFAIGSLKSRFRAGDYAIPKNVTTEPIDS